MQQLCFCCITFIPNPNWTNAAHRVSCGLDLGKFWFTWYALVCGSDLANGSVLHPSAIIPCGTDLGHRHVAIRVKPLANSMHLAKRYGTSITSDAKRNSNNFISFLALHSVTHTHTHIPPVSCSALPGSQDHLRVPHHRFVFPVSAPSERSRPH